MQVITILAGHKFRPAEAKAALAFMEPGAKLDLERDPENAYDGSAIRVIDRATGEFIGYVAARDNKDLAHVLDAKAHGPSADAYTYGLVAPGHTPEITRCEILDFVKSKMEPTIVIEVTTGWEVGTLVKGPDNADSEDEYLPDGD